MTVSTRSRKSSSLRPRGRAPALCVRVRPSPAKAAGTGPGSRGAVSPPLPPARTRSPPVTDGLAPLRVGAIRAGSRLRRGPFRSRLLPGSTAFPLPGKKCGLVRRAGAGLPAVGAGGRAGARGGGGGGGAERQREPGLRAATQLPPGGVGLGGGGEEGGNHSGRRRRRRRRRHCLKGAERSSGRP